MGCAGCRRRPVKPLFDVVIPTVPESDTLSAAKLTPHGWTATCYKCGKISDPQPFKHLIKAACNCKR